MNDRNKTVTVNDKLVLLVDDEPAVLSATRAGLLDRGFRVEAVGCAEDAMKATQKLKPNKSQFLMTTNF